MNVAVIARVPFDEGTLTGTLTKDSKWPEGDWRNVYFVPENLIPSIERVEALQELLSDWNGSHPSERPITLPELALRFILSNSDVSTIIPGMRRTTHVHSNSAASDAGPLPAELLQELRSIAGEKARPVVGLKGNRCFEYRLLAGLQLDQSPPKGCTLNAGRCQHITRRRVGLSI